MSGRTPGSNSLGWTTQSSFIPKESKKINVGQNSSMVDLKAKILQEKAKLLSKISTQVAQSQGYQKRKDVFADSQSLLFKMRNRQQDEPQNLGVDQRNEKDRSQREEETVQDEKGNLDTNKIQFKLAEKAKIYEQLIQDEQAHIKGKGHLVDYEQKRWDQEESYSKKSKEPKNKEYDYLGEMSTINDVMARERKAWEAEARREIEHVEAGGSLGSISGTVKDSATTMIGEAFAPLVKQRWDNILTQKEKEYLPEVIRDKARQQDLLNQARLKRDQDREARLQKIEEMKKRRKID